MLSILKGQEVCENIGWCDFSDGECNFLFDGNLHCNKFAGKFNTILKWGMDLCNIYKSLFILGRAAMQRLPQNYCINSLKILLAST
jgi:hypothetical protein